ncbi:MAG: hypothetical protein KatS3mg016_2012 [Fimbriimonadales bacterium]|nr:MAG: hypothetical protein KatS3mg016_2012 [Fimbriimonadales bacterium]
MAQTRGHSGLSEGQWRVWEAAFQGKAELEPERDVFLQNLWEALPADALRTLSPEQYQVLKRALQTQQKRHLLDIRGVIPLFFTQFYFVFLFGPDRRRETQEVLFERRQSVKEGTARLIGIGALALFLTLLFLSGFAVWYCVKCIVGVDILPGFSLSEYLRKLF